MGGRVRAGLLTEWLTVQSVTLSSDGQGGQSAAAPVEVCRIQAQPIVRDATELMQAESVASHARMQFRVRVRADVTAGHTVLWTPRWPKDHPELTFQILGVQPESDRQGMLLTCAAVQ
jgi:head-tail adaptor